MAANEKRVLVAEDDLSTRRAWSELISSWGYKVSAAADGEEALEIARTFEPHIILSDLKMPRKDGMELLREIREFGLNTATIMISGEGDIPEAVQSIKLGAYDYLRKPIDPPHLKVLLGNLTQHLDISEEVTRLRKRLLGIGELGPMIGQSLPMRRVMTAIE